MSVVRLCRLGRYVAIGSLMAGSQMAAAQEEPALGVGKGAGVEVWASTDSDGTDVQKLTARALWRYENRERFTGIAVEHASFAPATGPSKDEHRVYLDAANTLGANWRWRARLGTNGDNVLGSAELRRADWSQSLFIERELIETDQGLRQGIYYTFAGASTDIKLNDTSTLAVTAGLQEFSGRNERLHLRGRYVHALNSFPGLSAQLDARYYHSTAPGEFDYFSPRNFMRVLPLVQMRRFSEEGWMVLAAVGVGAQRSTGADWSMARLGQIRFESPRATGQLDAFAEVIYTNDSISGGTNYDYLMGRTGLTLRF